MNLNNADTFIKDFDFIRCNLEDVSDEKIIKFFSRFKNRYLHFFKDGKYIGSLQKKTYLEHKCRFNNKLLIDCSLINKKNKNNSNYCEYISLEENCVYRAVNKYDMTFESQVKLESYRMFSTYKNEIKKFIEVQKVFKIGLIIPDDEKPVFGNKCNLKDFADFDIIIDAFIDNEFWKLKFFDNKKVVSANDFLFCALFYSIKDINFKKSICLFDIPHVKRKFLLKEEDDHIFKNKSLTYLFSDLTYLKKCYSRQKNDLEMIKSLKKDLISSLNILVQDNIHHYPFAINEDFNNIVSNNNINCCNKIFLYGPCTVYSLFCTELNSLGTKMQQHLGDTAYIINRGIPDGRNLANDIILLLNDEHISGDVSIILNEFSPWVKRTLRKNGVLVRSTSKLFEKERYCFLNDFTHFTPKGNEILGNEIVKHINLNISYKNRPNNGALFYKNHFISIKNQTYCLSNFLFRLLSAFLFRLNFELSNFNTDDEQWWVASGLPHILNATIQGDLVSISFFDKSINLKKGELKSLVFSLMNELNNMYNFGLDLSSFDPIYFENMLILDLPYINNVKLEKHTINDLRFYSKEDMNGTTIENSKYYLLLKSGIDKIYYSRSNLSYDTQMNRFKRLESSILRNGFDSFSAVIYNSCPIVRDGSHRAAVIYNLYGNKVINVINLLFSYNHYSFAPMLREYKSNCYFNSLFSESFNSRYIMYFGNKTKIIRSDFNEEIISNKKFDVIYFGKYPKKYKLSNVNVLNPNFEQKNEICDRLQFFKNCVNDKLLMKKAFDVILKSNKQIVIMCQDGNLYSGIFSLLIQLLLKCSSNQIIEDFALSDLIYNHLYVKNKNHIDYENSKNIVFKFISVFLDKYGTIENWFEYIGFDKKMLIKLREKIL